MQTISVSPDFSLSRRTRHLVARGKLQIGRMRGETVSLGNGVLPMARAFTSSLMCSVENGGEMGGGAHSGIDRFQRRYGGGEDIAEMPAWTILDNPGENHPDAGALRQVDMTLAMAKSLREDRSLNPYFVRQLERYEARLFDGAKLLRNTRHPVVFIGDIGVGKTSMICGLTGLQLPGKDGKKKTSALIAGPGRTTVCEVEIHRGSREDRYALVAEPRSDGEIKEYVSEWCEYLMHLASPESSAQDGGEKPSVPKEIERAIRNMSGLAESRVPKPDGIRTRVDPAKNLAKEVGDDQELRAEILKRMGLTRRRETKIRGADMEWLRKNFADINDGKHQDFSIPERIIVQIPSRPFGNEEWESGLDISIMDTKGVDETAPRADLQDHFDDSHALVVLCSGFTNAPALTVQQILERARDGGVRDVAEKASVLVLPHGKEATETQRDGDEMDVEEAYEDRGADVKASLFALGVGDVPVKFYNVEGDDADKIRAFFIARIAELRKRNRDRVLEDSEIARKLMSNREESEFKVQQGEAAERLINWMNGKEIGDPDEKVQAKLLAAMRDIRWASSLRASISREGVWYNFNYYSILGIGAREIARARSEKWLNDFNVIADSIEGDMKLSEAHGFVREIRRWLSDARIGLLKRIKRESGTLFKSALLGSDNARHRLWFPCQGEWGRGPGYKHRVAAHNQTWFDHETAANAAKHLEAQFLNGWRDILKELRERLAVETPTSPDG